MTPRIGTAGWTIPTAHAAHFRDAGSHLERYAQRLTAAEINSSFHKPHRRATYERWAASVPDDFAFAAKLPKAITHAARLANAEAALDAFLEQASGLGDKLHVLLVQLPPSFAFDAPLAAGFFAALRERMDDEARQQVPAAAAIAPPYSYPRKSASFRPPHANGAPPSCPPRTNPSSTPPTPWCRRSPARRRRRWLRRARCWSTCATARSWRRAARLRARCTSRAARSR